MSRKYCAPMSGDWTIRARAGAEKGLLKPPSRMDGGFRLYSEEDVKRVDKIRRLQELLGVSLADALVRLRAYAFVEGRPVAEVARDVVGGRVRLDP